MATTYTAKAKFRKGAQGDRNWHTIPNANAEDLDGLNPLTAMLVRAFETPSTTLKVAVAAGLYVRGDGSLGTFAGGSLTLPSSSTSYVFLDATYALTASIGWPTGLFIPLAVVTTGSSTVTSVVDSRPIFAAVGATFGAGGVGGLAALRPATAENPSTSRNITVAAGRYQKADGTAGAYAGGSTTIPASSTRVVYLDGTASYALTLGTSYPLSAHVPIATATAGASTITSLVDDRLGSVAVGAGAGSALPLSGGTMAEGAAIEAGATTGLKIGASGTQKIGIWGATPIVRPGTYSAGYTPTTRALAAYAPAVASTSFSGIADGMAGTVYAQVADLNSLRAAYENLRAFVENDTQRLNALIADLKAIGLIS